MCIRDSLRFVVCTIEPVCDVEFSNGRRFDFFEFIDASNWSANISDMFDLISDNVSVEIGPYKDEIMIAVDNNPRMLKSIARKICVNSSIDRVYVDAAIAKSTEEVFQ